VERKEKKKKKKEEEEEEEKKKERIRHQRSHGIMRPQPATLIHA
jgi:hypothetical protein